MSQQPQSNIAYNDTFVQKSFTDSLVGVIPSIVTPGTSGGQKITNSSLIASSQNLQQILVADIDPAFIPFGAPDLVSYFNNYLVSLKSSPPTSLEGFVSGWINFLKTQHHLLPNPQLKSQYGYDGVNLVRALATEYARSVARKLNDNGQELSLDLNVGDWTILNDGSSHADSYSIIDFTNPKNPFVQNFNQFLTTDPNLLYQPTSNGGPPAFLSYYDNFTTTTALLQSADHAYVDPSLPPDLYNNLPTYQAIFQSFGPPNQTPQMFIDRLNQFYQQQRSLNGYFSPSQSFGEWVKTIMAENNPQNVYHLTGGSLDGNDSEKALILNRILAVLIKLINSLQNVGIVQANRLKYLTNYQQAYTALQTQVPVFLRNSSGGIGLTSGSGSTAAAQDRNDLNSSFNGQIIDNLRSLRGIQEDNAKQLQTNINQTNDAVNQQTDMVTSFIQELSTLLSVILR